MSGVNQHEHESHILSSISSLVLMAVILIFLYKFNDAFGEIFSQFLLFEVNYFVYNISFRKSVNIH